MTTDPSKARSVPADALELLPERALLTTGAVDHAHWNYRPILGRVQRLRFDLLRSMLHGCYAEHLLEIGYGSGVFFPELSKRAKKVYGIDPHPFAEDVSNVLVRRGVRAELVRGTATKMPYEDSFFQVIVAVSTLEFIDDWPGLCSEIKRVLAPRGIFALVTPGHSPLLDLCVRVMTGASPQDDFQHRRQAILPCLYREFAVDRRADYAPFAYGVRVYTALRLSVPAGTRQHNS